MSDQGSKNIYVEIYNILLHDWDPIGVSDVPQAQDEYDAYLGKVAASVLSNADAETIAEQLLAIETERMGLRGNRERALKAASLLVKLRSI
jgi:hypothetical protein